MFRRRAIEDKNFITEFGFLFALDHIDLGKTSVVEHSLKLTEYTSFNGR